MQIKYGVIPTNTPFQTILIKFRWNDFPAKKDFLGKDTRIDLVALTHYGDYLAIQCKCHQKSAIIDKPAVDLFLSTSSKTFLNESFQTVHFSQRLWISTTNHWGSGEVPFVSKILNDNLLSHTKEDYTFFRVEKMRFPKKDQKDTIIYNSHITIQNIPAQAYSYIVNGKSAIEWIMERYQITTYKDSTIRNDPNDWSCETDNPRYILDLLLSIISISIETVEIVKKMPLLAI